MNDRPPGADHADLAWQFRLTTALAGKDAEHQAEIERLLSIITDIRGALDRLLASETGIAAIDYRRSMQTIARQLDSTSRANGLEAIGCPGEEADPSIHRVVATRHDPGVPADGVIEVVRHGYRYRDRIVPAEVIVSIGPDETATAMPGGTGPAAPQLSTDEERE
jgi:molecular chaperone GrpE (heat shock protein)